MTRLGAKGWHNDKFMSIFDDEEFENNMSALSDLSTGKRIFLAKYIDMMNIKEGKKGKKNMFRENLKHEDREEILDKYTLDGRNKSIIEYENLIGMRESLEDYSLELQKYPNLKNHSSLGKLNSKPNKDKNSNSLVNKMNTAISQVIICPPTKRRSSVAKSQQNTKSDADTVLRPAMTDSDYRPESGGALDEVSVHSATSHWK